MERHDLSGALPGRIASLKRRLERLHEVPPVEAPAEVEILLTPRRLEELRALGCVAEDSP